MTPHLAGMRPRLDELCRLFRVKRLAVTGSASRGDFDPASSDLDLVVDFLPMSPREHKRAYFGLLAALEALVERPVDLIERGAVLNPFVRDSIERHQEVLYDAA